MSNDREYVMQHRFDPKGVHCPTCDQYAKIYWRHINAGMAHSMIRLYHLYDTGDGGWVNVRTLGAASREEGKLLYWGLVEQKPDQRGWWRLTQDGIAFVLDKLTVPYTALVYNDKCLVLIGEPWSIRDALRQRFDYDALMRNQ